MVKFVPTNLLSYLEKVKDPRRLQGQRHQLSLILTLTLMSIMSGYNGYRAIGDFIKRNRDDLLTVLKPKKNRLPSFDIIRQVLICIDFEQLSQLFYQWAQQHTKISNGDWISVDGKAIKGTLSHYNNIDQNFISLVSLYCSQRKLILGNREVINAKKSEIPVVQQLIESLGLRGITFTLDALHCQKKLQP